MHSRSRQSHACLHQRDQRVNFYSAIITADAPAELIALERHWDLRPCFYPSADLLCGDLSTCCRFCTSSTALPDLRHRLRGGNRFQGRRAHVAAVHFCLRMHVVRFFSFWLAIQALVGHEHARWMCWNTGDDAIFSGSGLTDDQCYLRVVVTNPVTWCVMFQRCRLLHDVATAAACAASAVCHVSSVGRCSCLQ